MRRASVIIICDASLRRVRLETLAKPQPAARHRYQSSHQRDVWRRAGALYVANHCRENVSIVSATANFKIGSGGGRDIVG